MADSITPTLSLAEAQAQNRCRICGDSISSGGSPKGWKEEFGNRIFPGLPVTLNFGKEFAHTACLERWRKTGEKLLPVSMASGRIAELENYAKELSSLYYDKSLDCRDVGVDYLEMIGEIRRLQAENQRLLGKLGKLTNDEIAEKVLNIKNKISSLEDELEDLQSKCEHFDKRKIMNDDDFCVMKEQWYCPTCETVWDLEGKSDG